MGGYSDEKAEALLLSRGFEALEPYPGAQEWWQCRCRAGHEVQVKLSKVLYGRGCPQCRKSKPPKDRSLEEIAGE